MPFHRINLCLILFACLFVCLLANVLTAQINDSNKVTVADIKTIHSAVLNEDRKIYVYQPDIISSQPLPVLYMLDGENISLVAGIVDYLSKNSELPPMIIVGIGNYEYDRIRDLSTAHSVFNSDGTIDSLRWKTSGGGENFLKFLKDEVMPYVEKNYNVSQNRILLGHSLGGLLTIHCLLAHTEMFASYIAVSPSLWWDKESMFIYAWLIFSGKDIKNTTLFFSDGDEGASFNKSVLNLQSLLDKMNKAALRYMYVPYPNETHSSELVKATQDGLRFVFENWKPAKTDTTLELVLKFYQKRSEQNGFQELPPEQVINEMGYKFLNSPNKSDEAIKCFELNTINYPASFNAFDSLGDGYSAKGDKAKAIEAYKKSLELNPKAEDTRRKLKALE